MTRPDCSLHRKLYGERAGRLCRLGERAHNRFLRRQRAYLVRHTDRGRRPLLEAGQLHQLLAAALIEEERLHSRPRAHVFAGPAHV